MGAYVNPPNESKESWLNRMGMPIQRPNSLTDVGLQELPVCLINNGIFTAAAIAYSNGELEELGIRDGRPKQWYAVKMMDLMGVSNLKDYLGQLGR